MNLMRTRKLVVKVSKKLNTHLHTHIQVTAYNGLEANNCIQFIFVVRYPPPVLIQLQLIQKC